MNLVEIQELAKEAIKRVSEKAKGKSCWPVNWARVRAIDVRHCRDAEGRESIIIDVVEASHDACGFQNAILREMDNILRERGSALSAMLVDGFQEEPTIEVRTQW